MRPSTIKSLNATFQHNKRSSIVNALCMLIKNNYKPVQTVCMFYMRVQLTRTCHDFNFSRHNLSAFSPPIIEYSVGLRVPYSGG